MNELPHDFGTGLRAHLGLEGAELELAPASEPAREEVAVDVLPLDAADDAAADAHGATLEALIAFEAELLERERALARREAWFAGRAGSLLSAAQALYDEMTRGMPRPTDDELARMRRRKSGAA